MNRALLIIIGLVLVSSTAFFFWFINSKVPVAQSPLPTGTPQPTPTNHTAKFLIYTNGTERVFSDSRYHNLSTDLFIASDSPNLIQVKKPNITWGDFFNSLPMELTPDCLTTGTKQTFCTKGNMTLKFYINGERVSNFLNRVINPNDRALVSFGAENDPQVSKQLEKLNSLAN